MVLFFMGLALLTECLSSCTIHRNKHFQIKVRPPVFEFAPIENVLRRASTIEQYNLAVLVPLGKKLIHRRAERSQPDSSSNNHDVLTLGMLNGPVAAKGTTHPNHIGRL